MTSKFTYNFAEPFYFEPKLKADFIELHEPTLQNKKEVAYLQSALMRALQGAAKSNPNQTDQSVGSEQLTGEAFLLILQTGGENVEFYGEICECFQKLLLTKGIAYFNGDTSFPLGTKWLEKLPNRDFDNIMGEYLVNFLTPSILSQK